MSEQENDPIEGDYLPVLRDDYEGEQNTGGRPRLYGSPEAFDEAVNNYHQAVKETPGEPLTLMGLILFMGFADYNSFYSYRDYDGFSQSVARARSLIMYGYEKNVLTTKNTAAARILGAFDSQQFNPATKVEDHTGPMIHEDRLAHLR